MYKYNNKKKKTKYHFATNTGTLCKLENGINMKNYITSITIPKHELCYMCKIIKGKSNYHVDWQYAAKESEPYIFID